MSAKKPNLDLLEKLPELDLKDYNPADYMADVEVITDYQKMFEVIIEKVTWWKTEKASEQRYATDLFIYPQAVYYTGQKSNPENFFVFSVWENEKTNLFEINHTSFWNIRDGNDVKRSPGISLDKLYYAKDFSAALEICANLTYHEINYLAKFNSLNNKIKELDKESITIHETGAKRLRDKAFNSNDNREIEV